MPKAKGSFEITSFNEDAFEEREGGAKLTHAWGDQTFSGDIDGRGANPHQHLVVFWDRLVDVLEPQDIG